MKSQPGFPPSVVPFDAGRVYHAFGEKVIIHLSGEQTNGQLCLWSEIVPPGGGPPPHVHLNEDEWFFVQEGTFDFLVNGEWKPVPAAGAVFLPRQAVHTFKNTGGDTGRLLGRPHRLVSKPFSHVARKFSTNPKVPTWPKSPPLRPNTEFTSFKRKAPAAALETPLLQIAFASLRALHGFHDFADQIN